MEGIAKSFGVKPLNHGVALDAAEINEIFCGGRSEHQTVGVFADGLPPCANIMIIQDITVFQRLLFAATVTQQMRLLNGS